MRRRWRAGPRRCRFALHTQSIACLGGSGKVFADRYHAHALKTPTEVANAIAYVLGNSQVHAARKGRAVCRDAVDALSSAANRNYVAEPQTWLLRIGWMWGGPAG